MMRLVASVWMLTCVGVTELQAQFFCGPVRFSSAFAVSSRFGIGFGGGFAFQRFHQTAFMAPPMFFGSPPYLGWSGVGNPWFFPPPVCVQPMIAPPLIIVQTQPQTEAFSTGFRGGYGTRVRAPVYAVDVTRSPPLPAPVKRENFVVVRPGDKPAEHAAAWAPQRKQSPPEPAFGRFGGDLFGSRPDTPPDPQTESIRYVNLARAAFAVEQYGRAGEHLRAAIRATPTQPLPYFLLAEAHCARGEYAEAVQAIRSGLSQAPEWPAWSFQLKALYGEHPERFAAHLAELEQALVHHAEDPTLLFLLGYHRWFLGDRDAAVRLFDQAAKQVRSTEIITPFLREAEKRKI